MIYLVEDDNSIQELVVYTFKAQALKPGDLPVERISGKA